MSDPENPDSQEQDETAAGSAAGPDNGGRWEGEGGSVTEQPAVELPSEPDYKDRWLRAEAELQNYRRRAVREHDEGRRDAEEGVMREILGALDDLDRALEAARGADPEWLKGVALIAQRLHDSLARRGVTVVDPIGQPFDPEFHEALLEADAPPGTPQGQVMQVVQKGYRRGDRALRAARVVVARSPAGSKA